MSGLIHDHAKWGPTDQIGAGNLLTAQTRLAALALIKQARVYDVSHEIHMGAPFMAPNQTPYLMSIWASWQRHHQAPAKPWVPRNDAGTNLERIEMTTHVGTHIDALGHFSTGDSCTTATARPTSSPTGDWTDSASRTRLR